jgi:hypothetical protein
MACSARKQGKFYRKLGFAKVPGLRVSRRRELKVTEGHLRNACGTNYPTPTMVDSGLSEPDPLRIFGDSESNKVKKLRLAL